MSISMLLKLLDAYLQVKHKLKDLTKILAFIYFLKGDVDLSRRSRQNHISWVSEGECVFDRPALLVIDGLDPTVTSSNVTQS